MAVITGLRLKGNAFFIGSLALLSIVVLSVNVYVYFNKCDICTMFENKEVGDYVNGLIGQKYVYIYDLTDPISTDVLTYEKRRGEDPENYFFNIHKRDEVYLALFNTPLRDRDVVFVFVTEEGKKLAQDIDRAMPYVKVEKKESFISCTIPRDNLAWERGAVVSYWTAQQGVAPSQWRMARANSTEFDWKDDRMPYPFRIELEGWFYVPADGVYNFCAIGGGDTEVSIDGRQVPLVPSLCILTGGAHRFHLRHLQTAPGNFSIRWGRAGVIGPPIYLWGRGLQNFCSRAAAPNGTTR
ncbi:MAG: hypothetical protein P8123_10940 [bacterium]